MRRRQTVSHSSTCSAPRSTSSARHDWPTLARPSAHRTRNPETSKPRNLETSKPRNPESPNPVRSPLRLHFRDSRRDRMQTLLAEAIGTMMLVLLGDGVVANVLLERSKGQGSGWIVITT